MKNLTLALMFVSSIASAQSYEAAMRESEQCQALARLSRSAFAARGALKPAELEDLIGSASKSWEQQADKDLIKQAINYGYYNAPTLSNAYNTSFARCLDTFSLR